MDDIFKNYFIKIRAFDINLVYLYFVYFCRVLDVANYTLKCNLKNMYCSAPTEC